MRTLVIGCNGQLGTEVSKVLSGEICGMDLPEIDITMRAECHAALSTIKPAMIVNCAAYTAVDACETDPACWRVNAAGPKHLAEWAAANSAFLAHISTDYVFDGSKPLFEVYTETDETAPLSEYGKSKLAGELAVLESGADAAIVRTAWLYGANGKNFLKTMLRLALNDPEREIRVVNDQFGSPTWSYTLARQIEAVLEARVTGVFHATSEGYCSWYDLAARFLSSMEIPHRIAPCTTVEYPTPALRPKNSILENAELKRHGLNAFDSWEVEVEQFVRRNREGLLREAHTVERK